MVGRFIPRLPKSKRSQVAMTDNFDIKDCQAVRIGPVMAAFPAVFVCRAMDNGGTLKSVMHLGGLATLLRVPRLGCGRSLVAK